MADVARRAEVSPMTVSRALREPEKVSEDTRKKILEAIEAVGYVPNRLAGSLASNRSNVVGLIVPSIKNSLFADTIQATAGVLAQASFHLLIAESGHRIEEEEKLIGAFIEQRVSGIILHNTTHTDRARTLVRNAGVPVIETGDLSRDPLDIVVSYSNFEASKAMTRYLFRRGYRRIGFVSLETESNDRARERRRGYLSALESLEVEPRPDLMRMVAPGLAAGRTALLELMKAAPKPDAVFFAGDVLAIGAAFECQRQGWRVPQDLAIAGFDDLDILQHMVPALTSLRLPRREIGEFAATILLERIQGLDSGIVEKDLGFDIVQREST
jgi:LacI family gluconate utilization system Gnt-I transcriptional repressor